MAGFTWEDMQARTNRKHNRSSHKAAELSQIMFCRRGIAMPFSGTAVLCEQTSSNIRKDHGVRNSLLTKVLQQDGVIEVHYNSSCGSGRETADHLLRSELRESFPNAPVALPEAPCLGWSVAALQGPTGTDG